MTVHWDPGEFEFGCCHSLMKNTIAMQQAKLDTYNALKELGLPIPPDLKHEVESHLKESQDEQ